MDLFLVSNTEIVGDVALLPHLPKCQHCPVVVNVHTEVNDDSNSVNARLWNKVYYDAVNEEHER